MKTFLTFACLFSFPFSALSQEAEASLADVKIESPEHFNALAEKMAKQDPDFMKKFIGSVATFKSEKKLAKNEVFSAVLEEIKGKTINEFMEAYKPDLAEAGKLLKKQQTAANKTKLVVEMKQLYIKVLTYQNEHGKFPESLKAMAGKPVLVGGEEVQYLPDYKSITDVIMYIPIAGGEYIVNRANGATVVLDEKAFKEAVAKQSLSL